MNAKWITIIAAVIIVGLFLVLGWMKTRPTQQETAPLPPTVVAQKAAFELQSSAFSDGGSIPVNYTCDGEDVRPPLTIRNVPPETRSLAIVMYDPDAPGGSFVHWVAWNISPDMREIPEGPLPVGVMEGTTSFRSVGYQGACPPSGTHRYIWRLYALRTVLSLDSKMTREDLEVAINTYVITQAELLGTYTKK